MDTRLFSQPSRLPSSNIRNAGDASTLPAVIEFDPASFVLTAYGRTSTGTVRGDAELAHRFLTGFFRI